MIPLGKWELLYKQGTRPGLLASFGFFVLHLRLERTNMA